MEWTLSLKVFSKSWVRLCERVSLVEIGEHTIISETLSVINFILSFGKSSQPPHLKPLAMLGEMYLWLSSTLIVLSPHGRNPLVTIYWVPILYWEIHVSLLKCPNNHVNLIKLTHFTGGKYEVDYHKGITYLSRVPQWVRAEPGLKTRLWNRIILFPLSMAPLQPLSPVTGDALHCLFLNMCIYLLCHILCV